MRLEYVEESGKGINTIVGKYGEEVFEFEDTYLQVNIPYNKKALPDENASVNGTVNKTEKSVLELLSAVANITVAESFTVNLLLGGLLVLAATFLSSTDDIIDGKKEKKNKRNGEFGNGA